MAHFELTADMIEWIHDEVVTAFLPQYGHVDSDEPRDRNLLESAAGRSFHTYHGEELTPSLEGKAALLFHAICCSHCFLNGNKRTAILVLDLFLSFNKHVLVMSIDEVYELAKWTAESNSVGRVHALVITHLEKQILNSTVSMSDVRDPDFHQAFGPQLQSRFNKNIREMTVFIETLGKKRPQWL